MCASIGHPFKAERVVLHDALTPEAALRRVAAGCVAQLESNVPGALSSNDPEYVHQMRVAVRRLRSALRFFESSETRRPRERFDEPLRDLGRVLGEQRNWDVFIASTLPLCDLPHAIQTRGLKQRKAARERVRETLASARFEKLLRRITAWLAGPGAAAPKSASLRDFASLRIKALHRAVDRGGRAFAGLDAARRHRVRIKTKRLRYAVEVAGSLFEPMAVHRHERALGALQNMLGDLTDINTGRLMLGILITGEAGLVPALQRMDEREAALVGALPGLFADVKAAAGFWKVRQSGGHHV